MEISILFKTYFRTNSTSVLMIQRAGAAQTPCRKAHCTSGSDLPFFESRFPICSRGEPVIRSGHRFAGSAQSVSRTDRMPL